MTSKIKSLKKRQWLTGEGDIQFSDIKEHYREIFNEIVKEIKENQDNVQS